ncbi:MAG: GAF domain-containing protein, partial [Hyphomicrobiaceae bacterium]|nr:GAF domain-containing protein [Hyphomicrobiaceae bacterium]
MKESLDGTLRQPDGGKSSGDPQPYNLSHDPRECENRLRFETLLTELSARLCNVDSDRLDFEISEGQRRVCESLGLDVCAVWQWVPDDPGVMVQTHVYRAVEGPPVPERMAASEHYPWSLEQVMASRTVVLSSIEDAPPEAARDLVGWRHFGIKTTVTVPLSTGNEAPFGAVSFNDLKAERQWEEALVGRLQLIAQVFANAILRKRSERALRQSEARLSLAAESAGAGLWSLNLTTKQFWLTDKARQLFDLDPDEVVTFDRFVAMVHSEDRDLIHETLKEL